MTQSIDALELDGEVLHPGDDGYDDARAVWNAMVDRRPAVIARCASTADVVAALRFGRARELEIGVRCGGHSIIGHAVPEGGLMIDLTPMGGVRVDPSARRAWVQGGALLGALDRAAQEHGLATTAGNVSHTGAGGLTLLGGMGWLARQYGMSCDNVESYELVTADGEVLRVTETERPDLFWGLKGGGGNFGIVTEFEFRLHPIDSRALVVELFFEAASAQEPMRRWRDLLPSAPREATLVAWTGPDDGRHLARVGYVWVGDPAEGRELLPALRGDQSPVVERVRDMSYLELQTMADDTVEEHGYRRYWKGHYLRTIDDDAIRAFLGAEDSPYLPGAEMQAYGGAIADVPDDAAAFSHRATLGEVVIAAKWTDPAQDAQRMEAARAYSRALEPFASGGYIHTVDEDGQAGTRRAYSAEKLARLTALKDRYDPENVFHRNANIAPGATT